MKQTKGRAQVRKWDGQDWPEKRLSVAVDNVAICISPKFNGEGEEAEANFSLIAEAFNVTNDTGLSPAQLAEKCRELENEKKELLSLLKRVKNGFDAKGEDSSMLYMEIEAAIPYKFRG